MVKPSFSVLLRTYLKENLAKMSLVGNIWLDFTMEEADIRGEICFIFAEQMEYKTQFSFKILQAIGGGAKALAVPKTLTLFTWTAKEVANSGGQAYLTTNRNDDEDDLWMRALPCNSTLTFVSPRKLFTFSIFDLVSIVMAALMMSLCTLAPAEMMCQGMLPEYRQGCTNRTLIRNASPHPNEIKSFLMNCQL